MSWSFDAGNISLGAGKFQVDKGSGYAPIGLTQDNQEITYTPEWQDIMGNETGMTLIDKLLKGEKATVTLTMMERTKENFLSMFPMLTEFTGGGGGKSYGAGRTPGTSVLSKAFKLHYHPLNTLGANGADDETYLDDDYTFWRCANTGPVKETFTKDGIRAWNVTFDVFIDDTKPDLMKLFIKGDPANTTIDVTAPTISTIKVEKSDVLTTVAAGTELTAVDVDTNIEIVTSESIEQGAALNYRHYGLFNETTDVQVDLSAAVITYDDATKKITINPVASLAAATKFVITVHGLKDTSGNQMVPVSRRIETA